WCFDCRRKAGSCQVKTVGTLFFFYAMLSHPESFRRQIEHLASFWYVRWKVSQILLAVLTAFYQMDEYFIRGFYELQMVPSMTLLPTWLLPTFLSQTLRSTNKTIRRGW